MCDFEGNLTFSYDGKLDWGGCEVKYINGKKNTEVVDTDKLSYHELIHFVGQWSEKKVKKLFYVDPAGCGHKAVVEIDSSNDSSILLLVKMIGRYNEIEIWVDHEEGVRGDAEFSVTYEEGEEPDEPETDKESSIADDDHGIDQLEMDVEQDLLEKLCGHWQKNDWDKDDISFDSNNLSDEDEELNEIQSKVSDFKKNWANKKFKITILLGGQSSEIEVNLGAVREKPRAEGPSRFPKYDPDCIRPEFVVTQTFTDTHQFKQALTDYSVMEMRPIKIYKHGNKWVRARCEGKNCPWKISLGFDNRTCYFHIKTLVGEHKCGISFKNRRITSMWLARRYFSEIKAMPTIKLTAFKTLIREKLGADISLHKARRTKLRVFKKIIGSYKDEYGFLPAYVEELKRRNPGTSCFLRVDAPEKRSGPHVFNSFYVCFDALKKGFKAGCRKIFGVDGCWLKGVCKGVLLAAVGRDGNDQMYPIAWAVVKVENTETWTWFLENLIEDLEIGDGFGWSIISDKQKGLMNAISKLLPNSEHRTCARHLYSNFASKHRGPMLEMIFWDAARSTNENDFKSHMSKINERTPEGYLWLMDKSPRNWCKAYFNQSVKCDVVHNNLCEAFNGSILEARCKSILSLLETLRSQLMVRLHSQREACASWDYDYGPIIFKKLEKCKKASLRYTCIWDGEKGYEVTKDGITTTVNVRARTCDCGAWQISGIPCRHACCAFRYMQEDPASFLDECYSREKVLLTYAFMMKAVPSTKFWQQEKDGVGLDPPSVKIRKGRPTVKRKLDPLEMINGGKMSRSGGTVTCSLCKEKGHNRTGCPKNPAAQVSSKEKKCRTWKKSKENIGGSQETVCNGDGSQEPFSTQTSSTVTFFNPGRNGELIIGKSADNSRKFTTADKLLQEAASRHASRTS